MKKSISALLFIASCFITTNAYSQRLRANAGLNLSNMIQTSDPSLGQPIDPKIKPGFHVGIGGDYELSDLFSLDAGLLFSTMGYKIQETTTIGFFPTSVEGSFNTYYLTIPIMAKLKLEVADINTFFGAGPYFAFGLTGNQKITTTSLGITSESDQDVEWGNDENTDNLKRLDFGLQVTGGVEIEDFTVSLFYALGLVDVTPVNGITARNTVFGVSVGYYLWEN